MKGDVNEKKVWEYIDKVCEDAVKLVGVAANVKHWHMIVGKDLIVDLKLIGTNGEVSEREWTEVMKRITFRLRGNVPKHFGLTVHTPRVTADGFCGDYSLFPNGGFDYQIALANVHPFEEDLVLCSACGENRPTSELETWENDPYTKMCENGLDIHNPYSFRDFYEAYIKTFGEDPLEVWIHMRAGEDVTKMGSTEDIEARAEEDLKNYGCKYYTVCVRASRLCGGDYKCRREKPIMKDGLVIRRWKEFHQELLASKIN